MVDIDADLIENKFVINFKPILGRTTRIESGLVSEDLGSERPIRNLIDTELDDILSEIGDLQKIHPDAYKNILEQIDQARILNNISKTIQMSVQLQMTDIYYTLASQ